RPRGRGARQVVDHRHEAQRLVGAYRLDHRVADHHVDDAGLHDVHAIARFALVEHDAAGRDVDGRARSFGEGAHVDLAAHPPAAAVHRFPPAPLQTVKGLPFSGTITFVLWPAI